jgi:hypothetical protein
MKIACWSPKESPPDRGQYRITQVSMQRRHRTWLDTSSEAIANDEVTPTAKLVYERADVLEIIAIIRVRHDDEFTARSLNTGRKRGTVSSGSNANDARTKIGRDIPGGICAAIVGNDHFAIYAAYEQRRFGFPDARRHRVGLVETRQHYAYIE